MVDFVNLLWISVFSFANFECKITAFFSEPQIIEYVIKHKSTKSIYDFIDILHFSSYFGAKKVRKKRPLRAASWGFSYAPDPTLDRKFSNTTVSWSLRRPAR